MSTPNTTTGAAAPPGGTGEPERQRSRPPSKVLQWINSNFSNVFSNSHWVYTLCFFVMALFIAVLRFVDGSLLFALYVATALVFTFLFLLAISSLDSAAPFVLEGPNLRKLLVFLLLFGISVGLTALAFYGSESFPQQYQLATMLPVLYMLIFFGWNTIQIFFIKKGLEDISARVEQKAFRGESSNGEKKDKGIAFLLLGITVPVAIFIGIIALLFADSGSSGYLLWNHPVGQVVFLAWAAAMVVLVGGSSFNAVVLYKQTVKHETPSVFSSFAHMLFLIYISFRSYQFINAAGKSFQDVNQGLPWASDLLDACIMVLTLLLLFKGLGSKLSRASFFSKRNLPFMTFLFSSAVIMGNMVLVLGLHVGDELIRLPQALVSAVNAFLMMAVAVVYYFLYLKRALMQRDQLERDSYSLHEVQSLLLEFTDTLAGRLQAEKAGLHAEMERFMLAHEIDVPSYSPAVPTAPKTRGTPPSIAAPAHDRKAGFFDGVDKATPTLAPKTESNKSQAEEKPIVSKYPLEQPKKLDVDGDLK